MKTTSKTVTRTTPQLKFQMEITASCWISTMSNVLQKQSLKRRQRFAGNGMVGFVAKERVDGKLVLPEAIKVLQQKA